MKIEQINDNFYDLVNYKIASQLLRLFSEATHRSWQIFHDQLVEHSRRSAQATKASRELNSERLIQSVSMEHLIYIRQRGI